MATQEYLIIPGGNHSKSFEKFIELYQKQGKRTIPIQEIAMAIVQCSCEKDCNPNFDRVKQVFHTKTEQRAVEDAATLARATETEYFSLSEHKYARPQIIVPETMEYDGNSALPIQPNEDRRNDKGKVVIEDSLDIVEIGETELQQNNSKRPSTDNIDLNKQAKKIKLSLDDKENCDMSVNKTTNEIESRSSTHSSVNKAHIDMQVPSTSKRKADEHFDDSTVKKEKRNNPFATVPNTSMNSRHNVTSDNPFTSLKHKVKSSIKKTSDDNPFKKIPNTQVNKEKELTLRSKNCPETSARTPQFNPFQSVASKSKNKDDSSMSKVKNPTKKIFSSTMNQQPKNDALDLDISKIGSVTFSTIWLTKDKIKDINSNIKQEIDPDMENFCDSFKNSVVVKKMVNCVQAKEPKNIISDSPDGNVTVRSFKKFTKVKLFKTQTVVRSFRNLKHCDGYVNNEAVTTAVSDEELHVQPVKKKQKKRFNF